MSYKCATASPWEARTHQRRRDSHAIRPSSFRRQQARTKTHTNKGNNRDIIRHPRKSIPEERGQEYWTPEQKSEVNGNGLGLEEMEASPVLEIQQCDKWLSCADLAQLYYDQRLFRFCRNPGQNASRGGVSACRKELRIQRKIFLQQVHYRGKLLRRGTSRLALGYEYKALCKRL